MNLNELNELMTKAMHVLAELHAENEGLKRQVEILTKENEKLKQKVDELPTKRAKVEEEVTNKMLGALKTLLEGGAK